MTLTYDPMLAPVLSGLTFTINPGEKVREGRKDRKKDRESREGESKSKKERREKENERETQ